MLKTIGDSQGLADASMSRQLVRGKEVRDRGLAHVSV